MDELIVDCFEDILSKITSNYEVYFENKEEFIKSNISNFIKEKNDEVSNMIFNRIINDINKSEVVMLVTLAFFILFFGFYPLPLMETFNVSVNSLINNYETALITN